MDRLNPDDGWGRARVEAAVAEAVARDCQLVEVTYHCVQAPGLYEHGGFVRMANLVDWRPGQSTIMLQRRLVRQQV